MFKRLKKTVESTFVQIEEKQVPAKIYREHRNGYRYSIGKNGAYLRMPLTYDATLQEKLRKEFTAWVQQQFAKQARLNDRFFGKDYQDGDTLVVGGRQYHLHFVYTDNKGHTAKRVGRDIYLKLTKLDSELHLQKAIKHLLSRVIAKDFLPTIAERVAFWNDQYFQKPIKKVSLKYTLSNWGSCSSRGNINLSTRLLFAPQEVIDYVIVHELAHLLEMNHSTRFWKIVKDVMPDYREKEQWLKKNGHLCDF